MTHEALILGKYQASYFKCTTCEYWFISNPHWLPEAYTRAISTLDTGILERNVRISRTLVNLLPQLAPKGNYVDWAGGLGILTRLMRDKGFNYYWQDQYATNELSAGFEWNNQLSIQLVSAFEVMEHIEDPLGFIRDVMSQTNADIFIFSQELHNGLTDKTWFYFVPETGQHISFYSKKTLEALAVKLELYLMSFDGIFILSKKRIRIPIRLQSISMLSKFINRADRQINRGESLTQRDKQFLLSNISIN